jgi:hypothetical protein
MQRTAIFVFSLSALAIAGCASADYVAHQSNFDVCRLSMGGPHAQTADAEAARRGLDCRQYYGAINAQRANEAAAVNNFLRSTQPPPAPSATTNCTSYRVGNTVQTNCR